MIPGPWRPSCCFAPVKLFEMLKVQILEYPLPVQSNTMVMVHSQRQNSSVDELEKVFKSFFLGDAERRSTIWLTGIIHAPLSHPETLCPYTLYLLSRTHRLPDCLMSLSLHRGNSQKPLCWHGWLLLYRRHDIIVFTLKAVQFQTTPLSSQRRTWQACVQLLCHRETEWGSVRFRHGNTSISSTLCVCNPTKPNILSKSVTWICSQITVSQFQWSRPFLVPHKISNS